VNPAAPEKPLSIARGVAVVGSTTIDRNEIGAERFVKLGGVTTYAGITYRRLGIATWVVSSVAPADRPLLAALQREGIRLLVDDSPATTRFVNQVAGGRRTQAMPSSAEPVRVPRLREALEQTDCVHLGPLHPRDIDPGIFPILKGLGALVVLDAQGYTRTVTEGEVAPGVSEHLGPALETAHVVKTNRGELEAIERFYARPLPRLMADFGLREWVVTRGPDGGSVTDGSGAEHPYRAVTAHRRSDPTGAGDVFLAAYVAARFAEGRPIAAACASAARLASEQLAGRFIPHGVLDLPSRHDIR
jgi:sugar/nucleoside kinase (ribokinase family)